MVLLVVLVSTYTASRTNPIKCLVLLGFHGVNHRLVLIFPRQSALKRAMVFGFCIGPSEISTLLLESDAKKTLKSILKSLILVKFGLFSQILMNIYTICFSFST